MLSHTQTKPGTLFECDYQKYVEVITQPNNLMIQFKKEIAKEETCMRVCKEKDYTLLSTHAEQLVSCQTVQCKI